MERKFLSRYKRVAEQELILRVKGTDRKAEVRVVGEIAQQDGVYTYGVAFVSEALDFWGVEFPPALVWQERPVVLALECSGRKEVVALVNGDFEYDICAIHGGLARYCPSRLWVNNPGPLREEEVIWRR
jgi:hypothetical protein